MSEYNETEALANATRSVRDEDTPVSALADKLEEEGHPAAMVLRKWLGRPRASLAGSVRGPVPRITTHVTSLGKGVRLFLHTGRANVYDNDAPAGSAGSHIGYGPYASVELHPVGVRPGPKYNARHFSVPLTETELRELHDRLNVAPPPTKMGRVDERVPSAWWMAPSGELHPVPYGSHSEWAVKRGLGGLSGAFAKGWARVTHFGPTMFAENPSASMTQEQLHALKDHGLARKAEAVEVYGSADRPRQQVRLAAIEAPNRTGGSVLVKVPTPVPTAPQAPQATGPATPLPNDGPAPKQPKNSGPAFILPQ